MSNTPFYTKTETDYKIQGAKSQSYLGIATTTTTPPSTGASWYKVTKAGTYTNFKDSNGGSIQISETDLDGNLVNLEVTAGITEKVIIPLPKNTTDEIKNTDLGISSKGVLYNELQEKTFLKPFNFSQINAHEIKAISTIKELKIKGYEGELNLVLVKSGNAITNFNLNNGSDLFIVLTNSIVSNENGIIKYKHSQNYQNSIIYVEATLNINNISDFVYSFDTNGNPNLRFIATNEINAVPERQSVNAIFSLKGDGKNEPILKDQTMYLKFSISEPIILGSVSVNVNKIPTENPAWIECGIFPPDNGYGTAPRITSSDQIQVTKTGILRLPLEHKLLEVGEYVIAFKTNSDCFDTVSDVNSFRGYDGAGVMPKVALHLDYPSSDKYGKFPAFSLHEYKKTKNVHFPADWRLKYEPENTYIGNEDMNPNLLFYWHSEGLAGTKTIRLASSIDGGKTKTFLHTNNIPEDFEAVNGSVMNAVSIFKYGKRIVYVNCKLAKIFKFEVENNIATWSEITPSTKSSTVSALPVASYAPLVVFKNYLYWGEYQDPDRPRIHKMNIDTNVWSVSIEKPLSGATGARHVHFLYKSPIDLNVLWAVWGDASSGGGQGLSRLEKKGANDANPDNWVQWTTGIHDANGTTLPYPTAILEVFGLGIIGAGDQPPTHLIWANNNGNAGKNLFMPLNFKDESAPNTETVHWLAIDDEKTIYYMSVEANPYMSLYASPFPYTEKFRISKYWQQALAGVANYSNGIITMGQFSFPKISFRNFAENNSISKIPYVGNADSANIVSVVNKLIENLQKSNLLQTFDEQGNDKSVSFWVSGNQFENFN